MLDSGGWKAPAPSDGMTDKRGSGLGLTWVSEPGLSVAPRGLEGADAKTGLLPVRRLLDRNRKGRGPPDSSSWSSASQNTNDPRHPP